MSTFPFLNEEDFALYEEANRLETVEAANDPEECPHKSRYAAQQLWSQLIDDKLANQLEKPGCSALVRGCLAGVYLRLARNKAHCEERVAGKELCFKGISAITGVESTLSDPLAAENALHPHSVASYLGLLNYAGFLCEALEDHSPAREHLHDAETLYNAYKIQQDCPAVPLDLCHMMKLASGCITESEVETDCDCDAMWKAFEAIHTHTIYYLAQVYKNMGAPTVAANYCEKTLVRQLESQEYDPFDWALNCATLSQFYLGKSTTYEKKNITEARHCLASAEAVCDTIPEQVDEGEGVDVMQREKLQQLRADIARCWVKYGITLVECSQRSREETGLNEAVLASADDEQDGVDNDLNVPENFDDSLADVAPLFPNLQLEQREAQIYNKRCVCFEDARMVFVRVQKWLNSAKQFYSLDSFASDAVELEQDLSRLYKALAAFEPTLDRKAKMHKRRIDCLKAVLDELNQTYYLMICRQLMFEIAETFNEMVTLKLEILDQSGEAMPTPHQVIKINYLCSQGINYFERFVRSYQNFDGVAPLKYEEDAVRPVTLCHFYLGRLYGKMMTDDLVEKLQFLAKSLENYRWIVTYCNDVAPEHAHLVSAELDACTEMVTLLPVKMSRIQDLIRDNRL